MYYTSNTDEIEVVIQPEYVTNQSIDDEQEESFVWVYHVVINNKSNDTIQLINRYWKIIDENGTIQEVSGIGVVGEQPILIPNENFKYSSSVSLKRPSGIMSGYYGIKKSNGKMIDVKIPAFSLDVLDAKIVVN